MAELDNLTISITADAKAANKALNDLTKNLQTLSGVLGGLNTNGLNSLAAGLRTISKSMTEFKTNDVTAKTFDSVAKGIKKLEVIDGAKLQSVATGLKPIADSMRLFSTVQFDSQNISGFTNAVTRLANAPLGNLANADFTNIGMQIKNLTDTLSGVSDVSSKTTSFINAIARLSSAGKDVGRAAGGLPKFGENLKSVINALSQSDVGQVSQNTTAITQAIAQLASAGNKTATTAANLDQLADRTLHFIQTLANAPDVSNSTVRVTEALARLASAGSRTGASMNTISRAFNSVSSSSRGLPNFINNISKSFKNLVTNLKNVITHSRNTGNSFKDLTAKLLMFYGKLKILISGLKTFWKALESSMSYIENLNYFNAAFGQVAQSAAGQWEEAGYDSAESYYNSFSKRAQQLTQKMTGFTITESGMLESNMGKSLGIDPSLLMNYQAMFAQMSNSMGVTAENALKLSNVMTELGADLASVKNLNFKDVWEDMASGMAGMSRTLDKYGANIRNVNLQQKLNELGIKASVTALNQNEKALLRTIILLDSTRYAWGDLSKTIDKPANQVRLLTSNFSNLARTIGNIFLPIVAAALPYINMFVQALQRLAEWIVKLLGFEDFDWGGGIGGASDALSGIYDEADNTADSLDNASESVKKLKKTILGFDQLNVLNDKDSDSDSQDAGVGLDPAQTGLLQDAFDSILDEYQKAWDEAFAEMEERANVFADNISIAFKEGGLEGVGEYIGQELTKAISSIPWETIYQGASSFGTGLASFLNGLISPELFSAVGASIANSLNTALHFLNSFGTEFDWEDFGTSLASGLNSFLGNFDWGLALENAKIFGEGLANTINSFFETTDWELVGSSFANGLNTAIQFAFSLGNGLDFELIGESLATAINSFFDTFDFGLLSQTINTWAIGILDALTAAVSGVEWADVAQAIADTIGGLDFTGIGWSLGSLANSLVNAFYTLVSNKEIWSNLATKLSDGINGILDGLNEVDEKTGLNAFEALGQGISEGLEGMLTFLKESVAGIHWDEIGEGIGTAIKNIDFLDILSDLAGLIWEGIKAAFELLTGIFDAAPLEASLVAAFAALKFTGIGTFFANSIGTAIANALPTITIDLSAIFGGASLATFGAISAAIVAVGLALKELWDTSENFRDTVGKAFDKVKDSLVDAFTKIKDALSGLVDSVSGFGQALYDFYENSPIRAIVALIADLVVSIGGSVLSTAIKTLGDVVSGLIEILSGGVDIFSGVLDVLSGIFSLDPSKIIEGLKELGTGVGKALKGLYDIFVQGGIDLIGGLLKGILDAIADIGGWLKEHIVDPIVNKFKSLFGIHSPSTVMAEIGGFIAEGLLNGIKNGITAVLDFFAELPGKIQEKLGDAKEWFADKIRSAVEGLSDLGDWIGDNVVSPVKDKFSMLKDNITTFFSNAYSNVKEKWNLSPDWFTKNVVDKVGAGFETLGTNIFGFFKSAWKNIKEVWTNVSTWFFDNVTDPVREKFETLKSKVKGFFSSLWTKIKEVWTDVSDWFKEKVTDKVSEKFSTLKDDVTGFFSDAWKTIKGAWENVADFFKDKVITPVRKAFKKVSNKIAEFFKTAFNTVLKVAATVFNGIITGIEKAVNGVVGVINGLIGGVDTVITVVAKFVGFDWSGFDKLKEVKMTKINIDAFAAGGFPEDGLFFANSTEMVGKFANGKTAVANNEQITDGIRAAVVDGMMEAMAASSRRKSDGGSPILEYTFKVDSETLYKTMLKGKQRHDRRYNIASEF